MKRIIVLIILLLSISGCGSNSKEFGYQKISNEERIELQKDREYAIIDVRTYDEYDIEHIKGAINIPYTEIENAVIPEVDILFVYCRSGNRSKIATDTLISLGYTVYDLGGIDSIDLEKE